MEKFYQDLDLNNYDDSQDIIVYETDINNK